MKKREKYLDLGTSIDVLNTLSGGIAEPQIVYGENDLGREIRLRVPGIGREQMQVEIHNNTLTIYYYLFVPSVEKQVQIPQVVHHKTVPYYIDISKINAVFEEDELVVRLPYNKLANGYHRKIRISEN